MDGNSWRERGIDIRPVRRPQPHNTIPQKEIRKIEKQYKTIKIGASSSGQLKSTVTALKIRQSHSIEYRVSKIVP